MELYHSLDLQEILEEMEEHAPRSQSERNKLRGWCACGASVGQSQATCVNCDIPIVWFNSRAWREKFGSPSRRARDLTMILPEDLLGSLLLETAGLAGFANKNEAKRWEKARRRLSTNELRDVINYCAGKNTGRAIIAHVLNVTDKRIREMKAQKKVPQPGRDAGKGLPGRK